jgi:hypothetical protein
MASGLRGFITGAASQYVKQEDDKREMQLKLDATMLEKAETVKYAKEMAQIAHELKIKEQDNEYRNEYNMQTGKFEGMQGLQDNKATLDLGRLYADKTWVDQTQVTVAGMNNDTRLMTTGMNIKADFVKQQMEAQQELQAIARANGALDDSTDVSPKQQDLLNTRMSANATLTDASYKDDRGSQLLAMDTIRTQDQNSIAAKRNLQNNVLNLFENGKVTGEQLGNIYAITLAKDTNILPADKLTMMKDIKAKIDSTDFGNTIKVNDLKSSIIKDFTNYMTPELTNIKNLDERESYMSAVSETKPASTKGAPLNPMFAELNLDPGIVSQFTPQQQRELQFVLQSARPSKGNTVANINAKKAEAGKLYRTFMEDVQGKPLKDKENLARTKQADDTLAKDRTDVVAKITNKGEVDRQTGLPKFLNDSIPPEMAAYTLNKEGNKVPELSKDASTKLYDGLISNYSKHMGVTNYKDEEDSFKSTVATMAYNINQLKYAYFVSKDNKDGIKPVLRATDSNSHSAPVIENVIKNIYSLDSQLDAKLGKADSRDDMRKYIGASPGAVEALTYWAKQLGPVKVDSSSGYSSPPKGEEIMSKDVPPLEPLPEVATTNVSPTPSVKLKLPDGSVVPLTGNPDMINNLVKAKPITVPYKGQQVEVIYGQ